MRVFAHLLPEADRTAVLRELLPAGLTLGTVHRIGEDLGARVPSPVDSADFRALERVIEEAYPETAVGPYFLPWTATDSRFFRDAGIPSYGFSPFLITVTDTKGTPAPTNGCRCQASSRVAIYRKLIRQLARQHFLPEFGAGLMSRLSENYRLSHDDG
jgi:hypothetical protein